MSITLSLANRKIKIPKGVVEDVLVQVEKFYRHRAFEEMGEFSSNYLSTTIFSRY